ncbi:MAG: glycosyltransferase family 2 protein [Planctomycetaceae bacterium]|nr:glycosyltransferase family 2 protein [Planctomycetaceae bacterium]
MGQHSLSIIVPALNEQGNLRLTVQEVLLAVEGLFDEFEILVFDDASTDGTAEIADCLATEHPQIRVFHNSVNKGLGWNYRAGVEAARMHYVILVNGKHDVAADQLRRILELHGQADVILPYHTNDKDRPWIRHVISRTYTMLLNILFGLNLKYFNDSALYPTAAVRQFNVQTDSYAFSAETVIKALRLKLNCIQVPISNIYPQITITRSRAFSMRNVLGVTWFFLRMIGEIYLPDLLGGQDFGSSGVIMGRPSASRETAASTP